MVGLHGIPNSEEDSHTWHHIAAVLVFHRDLLRVGDPRGLVVAGFERRD